MTGWPLKGKKSVKGKLKGQTPKMDSKKALNPLGFKAFPLAQREGFEPSSGFSRYTISNRARYDLFDTAANRW